MKHISSFWNWWQQHIWKYTRSRKVSGGKKKPFTANWVNRNIQRIWKNLCAQGDKAGNREKKKKAWIYHGNQCPVSGTLPEVIVNEHSSVCRPWTRVRAIGCKEEAIRSRNTAIFSGLADLLERHHQCWKVCFQGKRHHFTKAIPNLLHLLEQHNFAGLNWPAYSPDFTPVGNILHIIEWKSQKRRHCTVVQLESYIRQEWGNILVSSVSNVNRLLLKEEWTLHNSKHGMPNFFETCGWH